MFDYLVIGDAMLDYYYQATSNRRSQECPELPIIDSNHEFDVLPGGAANVALQIANEGLPVTLSCFHDPIAISNFNKFGINVVPVDHVHKLPVKTRFLDHGKQVIARWDRESYPTDWIGPRELPRCKVLICSDYDKGFFNKETTYTLRTMSGIVIADCKTSSIKGATVFKCNKAESLHLTGMNRLTMAAEFLRLKQQAENVIITLGENGAWHYDGKQHTHIPGYPADVINVVGAGDAFTAHLAIGLGSGQSVVDSARAAVIKATEYTMRERP